MGSLVLLNTGDRQLVTEIKLVSVVTSVAFSPDGNVFAVASADGAVFVFDSANGTLLSDLGIQRYCRIETRRRSFAAFTFTQCGLRAVSWTERACGVRIWESWQTGMVAQETPKETDGIWTREFVRTVGKLASWKLEEDGWIRDGDGHLLVWVPPTDRGTLLRPEERIVTLSDGSEYYWRIVFRGPSV